MKLSRCDYIIRHQEPGLSPCAGVTGESRPKLTPRETESHQPPPTAITGVKAKTKSREAQTRRIRCSGSRGGHVEGRPLRFGQILVVQQVQDGAASSFGALSSNRSRLNATNTAGMKLETPQSPFAFLQAPPSKSARGRRGGEPLPSPQHSTWALRRPTVIAADGPTGTRQAFQ